MVRYARGSFASFPLTLILSPRRGNSTHRAVKNREAWIVSSGEGPVSIASEQFIAVECGKTSCLALLAQAVGCSGSVKRPKDLAPTLRPPAYPRQSRRCSPSHPKPRVHSKRASLRRCARGRSATPPDLIRHSSESWFRPV